MRASADGHRVIFRATARSIEGTRSVCRRYPKPPNMSQVRSPPAGFKSVFEPGCSEFMVTSDRRLGSYRSSCHQRVWPFWVGGWLRPAASGTRAAGAGLVGRPSAAHEASLRRPRDRSRRLSTPCPSASSPSASAPNANRLPGDGDRRESLSRFARQTGAICLAVALKIADSSRRRDGQQFRSATACSAVIVMPCIYIGLKLRIASPITSSPAGIAHLFIAPPRAGRVTLRRHRTERLGSPQCSDQKGGANCAALSMMPARSSGSSYPPTQYKVRIEVSCS